MDRLYYYIDFGSGYTLVHPYRNQTKISIVRNINKAIQRKEMSGSFSLIESEFDTAFAFHVTSGNYSAPIQVYEHGILGTGNLVFSGEVTFSGEYDTNEKTLTYNQFKNIDEYTDLLDHLTKEISGDAIYAGSTIGRFTIEGSAANANKLTAFTWSSPNFSQQGNQLDIGLIGRPCVCSISNKIIIFDEHTKTLRSFDFDGTDFSASANGTLLDIGAILISNYGHCALAGWDPDEVYLLLAVSPPVLRRYQATSGTWTLVNEYDFFKTDYASLCKLDTSYLAITDDKSKQLQALNSTGVKFGEPFDLGEVSRPKICTINTDVVALIDENLLQLQAFTFDAGVTNTWSKTGTPIDLPQMIDPSITWVATNVINIHDTYNGKIYYYSFSGSAWTLTGTGSSFAGGISSGICGTTDPYTFGIISDALVVNSSASASIESVLLTIFDQYSLTNYGFDPATCGATFDIENCFFGDMSTLGDVGNPNYADISNKHNYTIQEVLNYAEIFQNYWYLEEDTGVYYIKFMNPNSFSSVGSDISVSVPQSAKRVLTEEFYINREKITFNNSVGEDFVADWIEYDGKNSNNEFIIDYPITNDFNFIVDSFTKRSYKELSKSGLFMIIIETDDYGVIVPAGTSPLSNSIRNKACSTTRIYEDYMKDYRYAVFGTMTINGNTVSVQDTARNVMQLPDIYLKLSDIPNSIGSFNFGTFTAFIDELSFDCNTFVFTGKSFILDL